MRGRVALVADIGSEPDVTPSQIRVNAFAVDAAITAGSAVAPERR